MSGLIVRRFVGYASELSYGGIMPCFLTKYSEEQEPSVVSFIPLSLLFPLIKGITVAL